MSEFLRFYLMDILDRHPIFGVSQDISMMFVRFLVCFSPTLISSKQWIVKQQPQNKHGANRIKSVCLKMQKNGHLVPIVSPRLVGHF